MSKQYSFEDLTGKKFNHLTVLGLGEDLIKKDGRRERRWVCSCDCGNPNTTLVLGYNLKSGNTTSCGCEHLKNARKTGLEYGYINGKKNKKYNKYDLETYDYGVGYTLKNEPFYFDKEDYEKIKDYCWYIDNNGYVANKTDSNIVFMHRLVMNLSQEDALQIDHIYHNKNDNRKKYLRLVSPSQNHMNKTLQSNNTSGVKGVYYYKALNKWGVEIGYNCTRKRLGLYNTLEEAKKVRQEAEEKYFGEYNYKN